MAQKHLKLNISGTPPKEWHIYSIFLLGVAGLLFSFLFIITDVRQDASHKAYYKITQGKGAVADTLEVSYHDKKNLNRLRSARNTLSKPIISI